MNTIVDFFVWLCTQTPPQVDEEQEEQEPRVERVLTEEQKALLWKTHFMLNERVEEFTKKLGEETNPVMKDGLRKTLVSFKRRLTYNSRKLKLL